MTYQAPDLKKGLMGAVGGAQVGVLTKTVETLNATVDGLFDTVWGQLPCALTCCFCCCPARCAIRTIFTCCGCCIPPEAHSGMNSIYSTQEKIKDLEQKIHAAENA